MLYISPLISPLIYLFQKGYSSEGITVSSPSRRADIEAIQNPRKCPSPLSKGTLKAGLHLLTLIEMSSGTHADLPLSRTSFFHKNDQAECRSGGPLVTTLFAGKSLKVPDRMGQTWREGRRG